MFFELIKIENYKYLNFEFKVYVEFILFNLLFDILIEYCIYRVSICIR